MRQTIAAAALLAAAPLLAEEVAVGSSVYRETWSPDGSRRVAPVHHLSPGDRVITVLRWDAPTAASRTAVASVPARLAIVSASRPGVEVSTDGGRNWQKLEDPDLVPHGTTHLRWRIGVGEGRLSYRAVVR
jgi:hypothetical protein